MYCIRDSDDASAKSRETGFSKFGRLDCLYLILSSDVFMFTFRFLKEFGDSDNFMGRAFMPLSVSECCIIT